MSLCLVGFWRYQLVKRPRLMWQHYQMIRRSQPGMWHPRMMLAAWRLSRYVPLDVGTSKERRA